MAFSQYTPAGHVVGSQELLSPVQSFETQLSQLPSERCILIFTPATPVPAPSAQVPEESATFEFLKSRAEGFTIVLVGLDQSILKYEVVQLEILLALSIASA